MGESSEQDSCLDPDPALDLDSDPDRDPDRDPVPWG